MYSPNLEGSVLSYIFLGSYDNIFSVDGAKDLGGFLKNMFYVISP